MQKLSRRTKFIILAVYYLTAILIGVLVVMLSSPICLQQECVEKSAAILSKMDTTANPCEDFYQFMCGSAREYPPPHVTKKLTPGSEESDDKLQSESVFKYMVRKVTNYISDVKSGSLQTARPLFHETLMRRIFTMCDTLDAESDPSTSEDVRARLKLAMLNSGMTLKDLMNPKTYNTSFTPGEFEYRMKMAGFPGRHFYTADIRRDPVKREEMVLYVLKANSFASVSADDVLRTGKMSLGLAFKVLVQGVSTNAKDSDFDQGIINDTIDMWKEIAEVYDHADENPMAKDKRVKMSEMQKMFPDLDFIGFLNQMGSKNTSRKYMYIDAKSQNWFVVLHKILSKYSREVKVAYQVLNALWDVQVFLGLSTYLSSLMQVASSVSSPGRACKTNIAGKFGGMIMSLTIERFGLERNPPDVLVRVFPHYTKIMRSWLNSNVWMDANTKTSGKEKLKSMKTQISLPKKQYDDLRKPGRRREYYNGLCFKNSALRTILNMNEFFAKKSYSLFTREANGFDDADSIAMGPIQYVQSVNTYQVPIFLLRKPSFDSFWPKHINFGGLGVEIGSELTSGFDLAGAQVDRFGVSHLWWTNKTLDNYKKRELACSTIVRRLKKKAKRTFPDEPNEPSTSTEGIKELEHGALMSDNWKSLMGVKMSSKAYHSYSHSVTFKDQFLPGLEMYSYDQSFFLAHAHMRCLPPNATPELKFNQSLYFHALSSLPEFRTAFKCGATKSSSKVAGFSKVATSCAIF